MWHRTRFPCACCDGRVFSPDGSRVVFQALGHIYTRTLPDGVPQRLTTQNEHFEFCPSWSRDGRWIVYTTWDDDAMGTVRLARSSGGAGRILTSEPGHYIDPVVSPDGDTVVFGRVSGGYLRTPIWSRDTGVYRVSVAGGAMERITTRGTMPQFGATSDRLYLLAGGDDVELISMRLDGTDERSHVSSEHATEIVLSPDGAWCAFVERFNVYVTPFVPTGRPLRVGPNTSTVPHRRVTHDAGSTVHWSGDGTLLHWTNGPMLSTCDVRAAFAPEEGDDDADVADESPDVVASDDEEPAEPDEPRAVSSINIGFDIEHDVPDACVAITGARLITMRGDEVIEQGTIVMRGNRIEALGPADAVRVPDDAFVIDGAGTTVVPGYCDVHAHGAQARHQITPEQNWIHYANLAFGVTTIHDPSNDTASIFGRGGDGESRSHRVAAHVFNRADSVRRGRIIQSRDRFARRCAISCKAHAGCRRDQREELQPAATRSASTGRGGGARARDDGRARGWFVAATQSHDDSRWSHDDRACDTGGTGV